MHELIVNKITEKNIYVDFILNDVFMKINKTGGQSPSVHNQLNTGKPVSNHFDSSLADISVRRSAVSSSVSKLYLIFSSSVRVSPALSITDSFLI